MEKKILLIGDGKSFMVTSIAKELRTEGFEVIQTGSDVTEIEHMKDKPNVYLIYEKIYNATSKSKIAAAFERPVNVKELAMEMHKVIEDEEIRLQKKKILVVDDDGTMLRTIKTWLSEKYQVFMANSGMAAITFLAKNPVDLILLDYEMPITTGPKVLEMLRSEVATSNIPVMFLTNKSDKESVMQVLALKPEKYLLKTMPPEELIASIDEFFEKQKLKAYM